MRERKGFDLTARQRDKSHSADWLNWANSGLMLAAFGVAYVAPFHLFLFSYAVLGPLHYSTEISWLHDRGYFLESQTARRLWLSLVAATLVLLVYGFVVNELLKQSFSPKYEVGLVYLVLVAACLLRSIRQSSLVAGLLAVSLVLIAILCNQRAFFVVAYLLVTIVHVLAFTAAFVLYGTLKSRSRSGLISLAVFTACHIACLMVPGSIQVPAESVRQAYQPFEILNSLLGQILGRSQGFIYNSTDGTAIMRLIAFTYTYHYLNWFSKTSIIGWHDMSLSRGMLIIGFWIASMILYSINYFAGFAVLYSASLLHVLLEFPLNSLTFSGIAREIVSQRKPTIDQM